MNQTAAFLLLIKKDEAGAVAELQIALNKPTLATIRIAPSGDGRCSPAASDRGTAIHASSSSSRVRITGMALG